MTSWPLYRERYSRPGTTLGTSSTSEMAPASEVLLHGDQYRFRCDHFEEHQHLRVVHRQVVSYTDGDRLYARPEELWGQGTTLGMSGAPVLDQEGRCLGMYQGVRAGVALLSSLGDSLRLTHTSDRLSLSVCPGDALSCPASSGCECFRS
jgi:hypothetical protein